MNFGVDKDDNFKHKTVEVDKEQILDLENIVPNFKIANVVIYFDESNPHLHIVVIPFKDGSKHGMEVQVPVKAMFLLLIV